MNKCNNYYYYKNLKIKKKKMQTNKQTNKQTINLYEINKEWEELHKRNATEPPRETK